MFRLAIDREQRHGVPVRIRPLDCRTMAELATDLWSNRLREDAMLVILDKMVTAMFLSTETFFAYKVATIRKCGLYTTCFMAPEHDAAENGFAQLALCRTELGA